ncbi:hypothetical protein Cgig2_011127 [Carnegiea gigantea]|uniref:Glycosyl transferase family 28 C-terminal domain-containing protein n=1 Tax=Carnegiea gigantea TaxID=171969 RepID=A0A9Q1GKB6_9CARY|nr:hypothetical protein Cgig2_011127 [Carnegiea gigantea]
MGFDLYSSKTAHKRPLLKGDLYWAHRARIVKQSKANREAYKKGLFEKPYLLCSNRLKLKKLLACMKSQDLNFKSNFTQLDQRRCYYYVPKLKKTHNQMGTNSDGVSSKKVVFVTMGTTRFDTLVRVVATLEIKQDLYIKGYTHLLIQIGHGSYIPSKSSGGDVSIAVDYFTFSSSIAESLRSASLVISHAGTLRNILQKYNVLIYLFWC